MHHIFVREDCHGCGYADTIVGAESSTIGRYPFAVIFNVGLDRIFLKVKDFVGVLLRHHIHVSLQDNARMILIARRGGFANKDVADLVLEGFQTERFAIIH